MADQLAVQGGSDLITFDDEKVSLIKRTVAPEATDDELALFLHQCQRTGLDPLARQIYFQKYNTRDGARVSIITGIDGYRLVADRTGRYAGSDEPIYEGYQAQQRYQDSKRVPVKASVTVYKIVGDQRVAFSASAYWDEYWPGDKSGHMWFKMPHLMLGKVAEALALRKAFPADLSGVYTREEMDQTIAGWTDSEDSAPKPKAQPVQKQNGTPRTMDWADLTGEINEETSAKNMIKALQAETEEEMLHALWNTLPARQSFSGYDQGKGNFISWYDAIRKDEDVTLMWNPNLRAKIANVLQQFAENKADMGTSDAFYAAQAALHGADDEVIEGDFEEA